MQANSDKTGGHQAKNVPVPEQDRALYEGCGFSPEAAAAIVRIDHAMGRMRRSMQKREQAARIIRELDPEIDLPRLDVIVAVMHWHPESPEDAAREVTVGTVAERLGVDPSRASRLVSDVIDLGYIRRAASQADARRIVLVPTAKGDALAAAFRKRKTAAMVQGLSQWTEDELKLFAGLVERFVQWGKIESQPPEGAAAVDETKSGG